ncbi:MAG: MFS transporter [Desulfurococcaceae archaeon]
MAREKIAYTIAATLGSLTWGLHLGFVTRYLAVELEGGTKAIIIYTVASWSFTLLALLAGKVSKSLGEKNALLLGSTCSIPIITGLFIRDPLVLAFLLSISSFPWFISWPVVLKIVFSRAKDNLGWEYSKFTVGSGIGYVAGSVISGPVYNLGQAFAVFALNATLPPLVFAIYYLFYTKVDNEAPSSENTINVVKKVAIALLSLTLVVFCREVLYTIAPRKLSISIDLVLPELPEWAKYSIYGLAYSGGSIISPIVRIIAGRLVDKYGAVKVYISTIIAYILIYWCFTKTVGLTSILVWQISLYPYLDTSFNVYIAQRLLREELTTGFGATQAFIAIGGLLLTPLLLLDELDLDFVGSIVTCSCLVSIMLMIIYERISRLKLSQRHVSSC